MFHITFSQPPHSGCYSTEHIPCPLPKSKRRVRNGCFWELNLPAAVECSFDDEGRRRRSRRRFVEGWWWTASLRQHQWPANTPGFSSSWWVRGQSRLNDGFLIIFPKGTINFDRWLQWLLSYNGRVLWGFKTQIKGNIQNNTRFLTDCPLFLN